MDTKDKLIVGKVVGVYGVKGWVKLYSWTEPRENLLDYHNLYIQRHQKWCKIQLREAKKHKGKGLIGRFDDYQNRDQVDELIGAMLAIERSELKQLSGDDYYWADLLGLSVVDDNGKELGKVCKLMETGANDVLVIKAQNEEEYLLPYVWEQVVKKINLSEGKIYVDWDVNFDKE